MLVASEQSVEELGEGAVPVSLVKANIPIQYRIKDLYAYVYNHGDPRQLLEAICYRELARFAASATVDVDRPETADKLARSSLLGAGRTEARDVLARTIQEAADERELGIELVFLGVQGIHPPPEVAPDYQAVIGAVQKEQALVLSAEAERNRTLTSSIGSVKKAYELAELLAAHQDAREAGRTEDVERLGEQLDNAFAQAWGDVFSIFAEAQSDAFEKATLAKATGERFASQIKAYNAAPEIYAREQRLAVLEDALKGIRKYVVVADANDSQVTIVDLQEKLTPNMYDIGGFQESSGP
jgi:membrane protease subunit HflK